MSAATWSTATVTAKVSPGLPATIAGLTLSEAAGAAYALIGIAGRMARVASTMMVTEDSTRLFKFTRYPLSGTQKKQYKSCYLEGCFLYPEKPLVIHSLPGLLILGSWSRSQ